MFKSNKKENLRLLIFCNAGQIPYNNVLTPIVRAFQRFAEINVCEPQHYSRNYLTGGYKSTEITAEIVKTVTNYYSPDAVLCVGGALYLGKEGKAMLPKSTRYIGIILSDPQAIQISLQIAPEFDLVYSQDPYSLPIYQKYGIEAKLFNLAVDPELYSPDKTLKDYDILFYGKWTK